MLRHTTLEHMDFYAEQEIRESKAERPFIPSLQQQAVFDWVIGGQGSAAVEAVAGSGKTTTLIEALKLTNGYVDFAAYNTKIADEIKAKVAKLDLGNRIFVGTFHSFGFGAWRRAYPKVKAGKEAADRKRDMTIEAFRKNGVPAGMDTFILKLVSLAKQRAIGLFGSIEDRKLWYDIVEHFDLIYELDGFEFEDGRDLESDDGSKATVEKGIELAIRTLNYHKNLAPTIIDFDDMVYMPLVNGTRFFQCDWIFVDERQDTNPARRAMARRMLKRDGRSLWVGDRHQAIYGFTGADSDACDQIDRDFNCVSLPLTVSYRCPKKVVEMAHEVVSHIQAHPDAPDGNVRYAEYSNVVHGKPTCEYPSCDCGTTPEACEIAGYDLRPDDAILCRNTKPLVEAAYALIKRGIACHVEGREIGAGLIKLVSRWKVKGVSALRAKLEEHATRQSAKLIAKGKETQAENLMDRIETIYVIMDSPPSMSTVQELKDRISRMFKDGEDEDRPTLTLATVHKSKGREWDRVFILGKNAYMPSPFARQAWQLEQERNLIYVAYTRAKSELVMVSAAPAQTKQGGV